MENITYKIIIAIIIMSLISFGVGFLWGVETTIREGVQIARGFINVTIDYELVNNAIWQYKNQVRGCFTPKL